MDERNMYGWTSTRLVIGRGPELVGESGAPMGQTIYISLAGTFASQSLRTGSRPKPEGF